MKSMKRALFAGMVLFGLAFASQTASAQWAGAYEVVELPGVPIRERPIGYNRTSTSSKSYINRWGYKATQAQTRQLTTVREPIYASGVPGGVSRIFVKSKPAAAVAAPVQQVAAVNPAAPVAYPTK